MIHLLQKGEWKFCLLMVLLNWALLIPLSLLVGSYRLSEIQTEFSEGLLSPNLMSGIRHSLNSYGFDRAHRKFVKYGFQIPIGKKSNQTYIGFNAQQPDFRFRRARRESNNLNLLTDYIDDDLISFDVNAEAGAHHLIIGATGSGKSTLMSRMALCALLKNNRVIIFDFKGGDEKYLYEGLKKFVPDRKINVIKFPSDPIDLFTGDAEEIAERLISFLPAATQGDGDYYRSRMIRAIYAVTVRTSHKSPRSIDDVLRRVRDGLNFAEDPEDLAMFKQKDKGIPVGEIIAEGLASRFEPLRKSGGRATFGGFKWSDSWDMAVLSFRNTSEGEVRLGGAILNSLDGWLWSPDRALDPRPILIMVDEGGVLQNFAGTPSLLNMVARARSAKCGVVVASQTIESMGLDGDELMKTGPTRWLGRTPSPETMILATGTRDVIEPSVQQGLNGWDGKKTGRLQKAFVIDPDVIRGLPKFVWSIGEGNKSVFVYVPPIDYKK
jgi:energy-coupling factor transporter ATP-binding protein EcfA2